MTDPLISTDELTTALGCDDPPIVIDVRWTLAGGTDRAAYDGGHIPGAVFVDFDDVICGPSGSSGRHPLPDPAALQAGLRRAGVDDDASIVVVDSGDLLPAARTWWTLRWAGIDAARVLDGGMAGWSGRLETAEVVPAAGSVTVRPGALAALDADAAAKRAQEGELIDVRAAERYRGETEPIDPVAGHIPGALNVPDPVIIDGLVVPPEQIRDMLPGGDRPAAYCGSGIAAARMVLAAATAGIDVDLYVGSWSDWTTDPSRPVATGSTPWAPD